MSAPIFFHKMSAYLHNHIMVGCIRIVIVKCFKFEHAAL